MAASNPAVYYKLLGLESGTKDEDLLKKAYRKAALRWHPDKNPDNKKESEAMFKKISEAYSILLFLSRKHGQSPTPHKGRRATGSDDSDAEDAKKSTFNMKDAHNLFNDFFGGEDVLAKMDEDPFFSQGSFMSSSEEGSDEDIEEAATPPSPVKKAQPGSSPVKKKKEKAEPKKKASAQEKKVPSGTKTVRKTTVLKRPAGRTTA